MTVKELLTRPNAIYEAPNSLLEKVWKNKGTVSFGKKKALPSNVLEYIRSEINRRNREGIVILNSFSEGKRLRIGSGKFRTYC